MAIEHVFEKVLTATDIHHRMSFPLDHLGKLPPVEDEREPVEFRVSCGDRVYEFRIVKRQRLSYLKPVIEAGWSGFVLDYGLKVGDVLEFYVEPSPQDDRPARYSIEVRRPAPLYQDLQGTTYGWQRIV